MPGLVGRGWMCEIVRDEVHVYPLNDSIEHDKRRLLCPCCPVRSLVRGPDVVWDDDVIITTVWMYTHNAFDGRPE
jgi:hypothetical protein